MKEIKKIDCSISEVLFSDKGCAPDTRKTAKQKIIENYLVIMEWDQVHF